MPYTSKRKRQVQEKVAEQATQVEQAEHRSPAVIRDAAWPRRAALLAGWVAICFGFLGSMARCAYCGVCSLGGKPCHWKYEAPARQPNGTPMNMPFFAASNFFARHGTTKKDDPNKWVVCGQCVASKAWAYEHVNFYDIEYMTTFFSCSHEERQLLGQVDLRVDLARRISGMQGAVRDVCLVDGPLFWYRDGTPRPPSGDLMKLFDININGNPQAAQRRRESRHVPCCTRSASMKILRNRNSSHHHGNPSLEYRSESPLSL